MLINKKVQLKDHVCQIEFLKKITLCCLQESHLTYKYMGSLKNITHVNNNPKKDNVAVLYQSRL